MSRHSIVSLASIAILLGFFLPNLVSASWPFRRDPQQTTLLTRVPRPYGNINILLADDWDVSATTQAEPFVVISRYVNSSVSANTTAIGNTAVEVVGCFNHFVDFY